MRKLIKSWRIYKTSTKSWHKKGIAIIIGLDSESAVSATDLNKIFGGAVHISNDEQGLLRALMFWNGVKFPSPKMGHQPPSYSKEPMALP